MQRYHEALEGSVQVHFQGNLINCMSCANEMIYGAPASNLLRTSTDFWPNKPESHGLHLYCNAQVSAWFGEFIQPDWDMFQSGHPAGAYHAAGRALSGGPIYVSDKPDSHDFDILGSLVMEDGSVLRGLRPGRPTADCILHDPTKEDVLLKIQNLNPTGGVIGAFNARYGGEGNPISVSGEVRPTDVTGLEGDRFAVLAYTSGEVRVLGREDAWAITLPELGWEIFTIVPILDGFAPLGLEGKLNGGGAVLDWSVENEVAVTHSGTLLAYSETRPMSVEDEDGELDMAYESPLVRVQIEEDQSSVRFMFEPGASTA
jgi:raffinose synthase